MRQIESHRLEFWTFPVIAIALVGVWQWATVAANYGGNWTALFCAGSDQPHPPLVAAERVYLFPNSTGYDGQFYHYIAHDPLMRSELKSYIDDPALRYRRILVSMLAYGIAMGRSAWIDPAYEIVFLLSIAFGVYWSCRFAQQAGIRPAWGLFFLLMPAVPIAMDRFVIDSGLAALTAAFLVYSRSPSWRLFLVLVCAALTRETGFLLILAYCAHLLWGRRFRIAGVFLLSALPAVAWYGYVQTRFTTKPFGLSLIPVSAILRAAANPWNYPPGTPFVTSVHVADYMALAGMVLGCGLALYWWVRGRSDPLRIAAMLFAVTGLVVQRTELWQNVYHFGRVYTPLLLCLSGVAAQLRQPWLLAPVAMMLPRLAIQLTPQLMGVAHWLAWR